jgi:predicted ester cyclase
MAAWSNESEAKVVSVDFVFRAFSGARFLSERSSTAQIFPDIGFAMTLLSAPFTRVAARLHLECIDEGLKRKEV